MSALNQIDIVADCVISARALLHESLVSLLQAAERADARAVGGDEDGDGQARWRSSRR